METDPRLLVGAHTADDAGVYQLTEDLALIQTVDFFTPIVNDPFLFGRIAAVNALSDVYAMGGRPLTAMNICCFPVKELPHAVLREILRGGLEAVHQAGALMVGGHSVEDPELKYGLSVTGVVHPAKVVTNGGLRPGQKLILTKPLGTGVIATALKAGLASAEAVEQAVSLMTLLNRGAAEVMEACQVTGATDVTGFGLLGHALEMARASGVGLEIDARVVPIISQAREMAGMGLVPLGSHRNRDFCSHSVRVQGEPDPILMDLLADTQTSGGMLMGVPPERVDQARELLAERQLQNRVIGQVREEPAGVIIVRF